MICLASISHTQAQKANFRYYSVDEGLPQATVYDMLLDHKGYLWFGTQGGLSHFDGKDFKIYNQGNGLAGNHVLKLFQDSKQNIWIGYRYEGLSKWDGTRFFHYKDALSGIKSSVSDILEDTLGNIWIGTKGDGIYVLRFASEDALSAEEEGMLDHPGTELKTTVTHLTTENGIWSNFITALEEDGNGNIWIGTSEGIQIINPNQHDKITKALQPADFGFKTRHIADIKITGNSAWVATLYGLCHAAFDSDFNITIVKQHQDSEALSFQKIDELYVASNGSLWIATSLNGVIRLEDGIFKKFTEKEGLSNINVSSIIEDNESNIWIGCWGTGVCQYLGDNFEIFDKTSGLPDHIIDAVLVDRDFGLWVGTEKGLTRFSFSDTLMKNITRVDHFTTADGLTDNDIMCLFQDSKDYIWIGTRTGVTRYNPFKNTFRNYAIEDPSMHRRILSINEDKNGNIWFCDLGSGCTQLSVEHNNGNINDATKFTTETGFFSNAIWTVFKDRGGDLWFGSNDAAIAVYDGEKFKFINEEQGFMHKRPGAITEDKYGNIWIGSIGGGVYKYDGTQFSNYTTKDGISSDNPYITIGDDLGNIWIGTNTGVDRLNVKTGKIDHYGKAEGFLGIETNQNAAFKDGMGNIWLGTIKGLVRCNPSSFEDNLVEPITAINKVRIFLKEEDIPDNNIFPYNKNHLTFDFTGTSYSNPNRVKFTYTLMGFDEEWSPVTDEHIATYSNIPPGKYRFLLRAANSDGIWNKDPVAFEFEVTPPFWKTWWFYSMCVLSVVAAVVAFIKIRERNLRREKAILEAKVQHRTVQIEKQKEELAVKNKDITDSIRYAQDIQKAVLPTDELINELLPDSFVFFRPKDIVSGDFYWITAFPTALPNEGPSTEPKEAGTQVPQLAEADGIALGDGLVFFAACDCTGHGVPGAFMSMMINSMLNETVNKRGITKPNEILNEVRKGIIHALNQENGQDQKDGMDAALCVLSRKTMTLDFAGANNSLFIIRSNATPLTSDHEEAMPPILQKNGSSLFEIKPDKQPVGLHVGGQVPFTNHQIQLQKGDTIYAFSDGFQDQFGGPTGKKFMIKRQKQLLIDIQDKSMPEQKILLDQTFKHWKGDQEQVDDILVIGVRV